MGLSDQGQSTISKSQVWFAALNERPAYDRVKTDAATINLLYADYGVGTDQKSLR